MSITAKQKARIMVIDDDLDTLRLLEMILKKAGHEIVTASGYQQMVDYIKNSPTQIRFDILILDLMMPGFSGYDILEMLRMYFNPVPKVIVLSALSGMSEAIKALEGGATKYLTKPTTQEKLLNSIQEVLRGDPISRF